MNNQEVRPNWIIPLRSGQAALEEVGGKGANLIKLAQAGFQVPDGFILSTKAYQDFLEANRLEEPAAALVHQSAHSAQELEGVSEQIRGLFSTGKIPDAMAAAVLDAYEVLGRKAVAVRSSATAEDLPEMSFAGQQDTFLNVLGEEDLLASIINCWSSLWTARAIGYRERNQVPHHSAALAVVVQGMVESQASGVMFTANPLSGLRTETVIDAAFGLGEALVSGRVDPDHYEVDAANSVVLSKYLGAKHLSIHAQRQGGTAEKLQSRAEQQALSDEQILTLASLGRQIDALYELPQDIEWALAENHFYILQSRPVTSLFPLPANLPVEPLKVFFSFAAIQGVVDPITPAGMDAIKVIFAAGAGLFGIQVNAETQTALYSAGERLWINFTPLISNSVGRRVIPTVLSLIEPTIRQAVEKIWDDPRLQPGRKGITLRSRFRLARFFLPLFANVFLNMLRPRQRREFVVGKGEKVLAWLQQYTQDIQGDKWEKLAQRAELMQIFADTYLKRLFALFVSGVAAGMAAWNIMRMLTSSAEKEGPAHTTPATQDLILQVTRGMPFNPTTEMDLMLWQIAKKLQQDEGAKQAFERHDAAQLAALFDENVLPDLMTQQVHIFLARYGGRGLGEIDLGRARWAQEPAHVFEMLDSFMQISDEDHAPDVMFARGADSAKKALQILAERTKQAKLGWLKTRLLRFLSGRARGWMGVRESPKFFAVRLMAAIQRELIKSGEDFVNAGTLDKPDDIFYLSFGEMRSLAAKEDRDWRKLVLDRRETYQRELRRRQIPRVLLSDGRAFYEGLGSAAQDSSTLHGSPVSPGVVEGDVKVVLDPRRANLKPGEIMVCPGTDPSWTPLFLSAGGLVMETGGMMTHGAVVAREYGIPAVVGVNQATRRLADGQRIRLDGSSGMIEIIGDP